MRFLLSIFLVFASAAAVFAQQFSMSCDGKVTCVETDLDASTYQPKLDQNDNLCALIKVTVTNTLKNPLVLDVGGLAVVARVEQENGEIWYYVPAQVKNLNFSCQDYTRPAPVPVSLQPGRVYRLTIVSDAVISTVTTAVVSANFLKIRTEPQNVHITLWNESGDKVVDEILNDGNFTRKLNHGDYHYLAEHRLYKPREGVVKVSAENDIYTIALEPDYGIVKVNTEPESGADIYINDFRVGQSPLASGVKVPSGRCTIRAQRQDYYSVEQTVEVEGNGIEQTVTLKMKPQYGEVTCVSEDPEAEIWVDNEFRGTGEWTGRLNSSVSHLLEARKSSHQSQSVSFTVRDGEVLRKTVGAPVPLYASLTVVTDPPYCNVSVDGKSLGQAPLVSQVLMGTRIVTVSCDGYEPETRTVTLDHNETGELDVTLNEVRREPEATLFVYADKKNASVYVDDELRGTTPLVLNLPPGAYSVRVTKGDYVSRGQKFIVLSDGETESLNFALERVRRPSASMDVFARSFVDVPIGYHIGNQELMLGLTYANVKRRVGGYGTVLYGIDNSDVVFSAGPVVRLTGGGSAVDFQLYGGLGGYVDDGFSCIFDFGFRLGGRTSGRLSWWDISLGCMANGGNVILNVGLGLGISLIAGTVAGSVGLATM